MKKLIIIAAAILIVYNVFGVDFSIGGRALGVAQIVGNTAKGVGKEGTEPWTRWTDDLRLNFLLTNDEGTAGGGFRLTGKVWEKVGESWFQAWWQPHDMLYFSVGKIQEIRKYNPEPAKLGWGYPGNNDAFDMQALQFAPWEKYQDIGPHNDNIYAELKAVSDRVGMQVSFIPIDSLHLTVVWNGFETSESYSRNHASVKNVLLDRLGANISYTTPLGGQASVFFINAGNDDIRDVMTGRNFDLRKIGLMYTQQILNPLYAEATVLLPLQNSDIPFIGFGLGLGYKVNRQFNINARFAGEICLIDPVYGTKGNILSGHDNTKIGFDIAPCY